MERLRELADAWNSGEVEGVLARLGPEFVFRPDPSFPDARPMSGEELGSWLHQWADTWAGSELELFDLEDHGHGATARARWHLRPTEGEVELPVADFTFVVWFDETDRPARCAAFFDHDQALTAIGDR